MKAAFSNFCLPGCDISQRNEVEKSPSFESAQLLIPTVVLMTRDRIPSKLEESLVASDEKAKEKLMVRNLIRYTSGWLCTRILVLLLRLKKVGRPNLESCTWSLFTFLDTR